MARASAYEGLIDADDACFLSPESMKRPQMKKKMSVFRCLICISSLPVQPSVSILLTL